jgi:hypothetical protein
LDRKLGRVTPKDVERQECPKLNRKPLLSAMNPRCSSCNNEMSIANFGQRCFVCEACPEFLQLFEVHEPTGPVPWRTLAAEIRLEFKLNEITHR